MNRNNLLFIAGLFILIFHACKKDDSPSCVSCSSPQTSAFDVCEESDGTASVNGQNTGTNYSVYINDLVTAGSNCGE